MDEFEKYHRVENGLIQKEVKPEDTKLGYSTAINQAIYDEYDVYWNEKEREFMDGTGQKYSLFQAVERNVENFKQKRQLLKLKARNANNHHPELLELQRKYHHRLFRDKKD